MFSGVFIIFLGLRQRSQQLEMHASRADGDDRTRARFRCGSREHLHVRRVVNAAPSSRSLSIGIIVVGLGLALMTIISVAGESPEVGIGIGGAIAILGGAFIVRSLLVRPEASLTRSTAITPPPPTDDRI